MYYVCRWVICTVFIPTAGVASFIRVSSTTYQFIAYPNVMFQIQMLVGSRWCSWLRHCATRRKVAGSIPDSVIGIFHWHNSSAALWPWSRLSLQQKWVPVICPTDKGGQCLGLTTLQPSCADLSWNLGASPSWNTQGQSRPVQALLLQMTSTRSYSTEYYILTMNFIFEFPCIASL